jgi:Tfp pilus assembly protein PilX
MIIGLTMLAVLTLIAVGEVRRAHGKWPGDMI